MLLRTAFQYPVHFTNTFAGSWGNRYKHLTLKLALFRYLLVSGRRRKQYKGFQNDFQRYLGQTSSGGCKFDRRKKLCSILFASEEEGDWRWGKDTKKNSALIPAFQELAELYVYNEVYIVFLTVKPVHVWNSYI